MLARTLISGRPGRLAPIGPEPAGPARRTPWWRRAVVLVGLPLLVGLVHVALVAPHYFVGSFDDDSSYILAARALLAGHGLTGHERVGRWSRVSYPPGYGALLAPLVWLWPHTFVPLRLLSVACYAGALPPDLGLLERRGVGQGVRACVLWLLALGPTLATFGSMVMAEAPFLVLFMVFLLLSTAGSTRPGS